MEKFMKSFLLLSLLLLSACGEKKKSVNYGKTTKADLVAELGEPEAKKSIPVRDGEVFEYPNNEKYQIQNDIVTYGFKDPVGDQKTVIYWKHKFKDCDTVVTNVPSPDGHQPPVQELTCPAEGLTVVFTQGSEFVSRIIEHDKK